MFVFVQIPFRMRASKIAKVVKKARIMDKFRQTSMYRTVMKRLNKRWSTDLERWRVAYNKRQVCGCTFVFPLCQLVGSHVFVN